MLSNDTVVTCVQTLCRQEATIRHLPYVIVFKKRAGFYWRKRTYAKTTTRVACFHAVSCQSAKHARCLEFRHGRKRCPYLLFYATEAVAILFDQFCSLAAC